MACFLLSNCLIHHGMFIHFSLATSSLHNHLLETVWQSLDASTLQTQKVRGRTPQHLVCSKAEKTENFGEDQDSLHSADSKWATERWPRFQRLPDPNKLLIHPQIPQRTKNIVSLREYESGARQAPVSADLLTAQRGNRQPSPTA